MVSTLFDMVNVEEGAMIIINMILLFIALMCY